MDTKLYALSIIVILLVVAVKVSFVGLSDEEHLRAILALVSMLSVAEIRRLWREV